ncbi:Siroheme decarboxylase NirL subunit [Gammaproteobacteria bacterium]
MSAVLSLPLDPAGLDGVDRRLVEAIQGGLPLSPRPYASVGSRLGLTEGEVIARIRNLLESGIIRRLGVVVRHQELGYRANAMVVWDIPDAEVAAVGVALARYSCVTLCYRRARHLPQWPYNLYCMIHGSDREAVLAHLEVLTVGCGLEGVMREVLFSTQRFKQRGADYRRRDPRRVAEGLA